MFTVGGGLTQEGIGLISSGERIPGRVFETSQSRANSCVVLKNSGIHLLPSLKLVSIPSQVSSESGRGIQTNRSGLDAERTYTVSSSANC